MYIKLLPKNGHANSINDICNNLDDACNCGILELKLEQVDNI